MSEINLKEKIQKLLEFKPKEVPEAIENDLYKSIHGTWTGLWTDFHGEWDELQASDVFPISYLLSGDAEERLTKGIEALIKQDKLEMLEQVKENYLDYLVEYGEVDIDEIIQQEKDGLK